MAPVTNARVLFNEYPSGYPDQKTLVIDKSKTIDLDNEPLNGGVLVKVLVLSVDPYIRGMMNKESYRAGANLTLGEPIPVLGISKVIRSENPTFSVGDHLYGGHPTVEYAVLNDPGRYQKLDNSNGLPWSVYLGVCGMPGRTAHHGYKEFMKPYAKDGDVIFITTGAGPVGSLLIQIAKLDGLTVIASAGSDDKVTFMKECGADVAFNYKTIRIRDVLNQHGPIKFYWDHVGGDSLDAALEASARFAHFVICGQISTYNEGPLPVKSFDNVLKKSLTINGFVVPDLADKYDAEFLQSVPPKVAEGEFKHKEYIRRGLETFGQTLLDVMTGKNFGKAVIVVADD